MEVVTLPGFLVAGFRVEAGWNELWTQMPKAWQRLMPLASSIPSRVNDVLLDASLDKRGETYEQFIGAEVSKRATLPDGMEIAEIPPQTYVHDRHEGPLRDIATSFGRIYAWAESQGLAADEFKLDIGYTPSGDETFHDLYVRIDAVT